MKSIIDHCRDLKATDVGSLTEAEKLHCEAFDNMLGLDGVAVNKDEGVRLFWLSAEKGYLESAIMLGVLYLEDLSGRGLVRNEGEAVRCFEYASSHGSSDAKAYLARCYADGIGLPQDLRRAKELYSQAAQEGCLGAIRGLSRVCILLGEADDGARLLDEAAQVFDIR